MMKLSIIVLTHNRLPALRECLIRIQTQTVSPSAQLIVVDNGSTDGTPEWLVGAADMGPYEIESICLSTNEGVCARNHGIRQARGEFIAQVDDDVLVMSGWDKVLTEAMERDPQIGAVGQHGFFQEQSWARTPWSAGLLDDRRRPAEGQFCDFVMGYCWAWRNDREPTGPNRGHGHAWHRRDGQKARCGGPALCGQCAGEKLEAATMTMEYRPRFLYDERFNPFWHEESDLQLQIRAAGYRILKVREVASHRSLPHIRGQRDDVAIAERNFNILKSKWQNDPRIKYEGAAVGLR